MQKNSPAKCDSCGKFSKREEIIGCANEDQEWTECFKCTSPNELARAKEFAR